MSKLFTTIVLLSFAIYGLAQNKIYSNQGKSDMGANQLSITVSPSGLAEPTKSTPNDPLAFVSGTAIASFVNPETVYNIGTDILKRRKKKFTAEMESSTAIDIAGSRVPPHIDLSYDYVLDGETKSKNGYTIDLNAINVRGDLYAYELASLKLSGTPAKGSKSDYLDVAIQVKLLTEIVKDEQTQIDTVDIKPITVKAVSIQGNGEYQFLQGGKTIKSLPFSMGTGVVGVEVKVVVTNTRKARVEDLIKISEDYKDQALEILRAILGEEEGED